MRDGFLTPERFEKLVGDLAAELQWLANEGRDAYRWAQSGLGFPSGVKARLSGVADPTAAAATGRDVARLEEVRDRLLAAVGGVRRCRRLLESPAGDVVPDTGQGWVSERERTELVAAQRRREARGENYGEA